MHASRNFCSWTEREDAVLRDNFRDMSDYALACRLSRSLESVKARRRTLGLLCSERSGVYENANYEPSPEEIAAACAEIQATWTDAEREKRAKHVASRAVEIAAFGKSGNGGFWALKEAVS